MGGFRRGVVAKLGATVVTYPILLVKSRLQSQSKGTEASMRYDGALDAPRRIAAEEGLGAFYRGFGTKATQTVRAALCSPPRRKSQRCPSHVRENRDATSRRRRAPSMKRAAAG